MMGALRFAYPTPGVARGHLLCLPYRKLGKPLRGNGRTPWPKSAEAWRSGHSLANIVENLRGVQALYTGDIGRTEGPGFDDYVTALGAPLGRQITRQIELTLSTVRAVPEPLRNAVQAHPGRVESAYQAVHTLLVLLKALTNLLGVTIDFSDNDGD